MTVCMVEELSTVYCRLKRRSEKAVGSHHRLKTTCLVLDTASKVGAAIKMTVGDGFVFDCEFQQDIDT